MPVYEYQAVDLDASTATGTVIADTSRQARDTLRDRGLRVTNIRAMAKGVSSSFRRRRRRTASVEVVRFVRELATLLAAGIPLLSALGTLAKQHRPPFRGVIQGLADQVASGQGLAEAMACRSDWFDEMAANIVCVGETTGSLDAALLHLAEFKEKTHRLRSRVISALLYPAIVCVVGVIVCLFLMTYVVPNLLTTLAVSDRPLPAITEVVKQISDFLIAWWPILLGSTVASFLVGGALLRTERGRLVAHTLVLRLPLVGDLIRKENTSRMAVVLAALLRSGLQFIEAVRITRQTLRNVVFRRALETYEQAIAAGRDVSAPLEETGVFPPMVVQMLAVGQQTGEMETMLEQMAVSYDHDIETATHRLTSAMEPLLIVALAVLVGFIAFATLLPILEAGNVL